jgi:hypothetical protein
MLRPQTTSFIVQGLHKLSREQRRSLVGDSRDFELRVQGELSFSPGVVLATMNVIEHPDILSWTVLEGPDEVKYAITPKAAHALAAGDAVIEVDILGGGTMIVTREQVDWSLRHGQTFDQLERNGDSAAAA